MQAQRELTGPGPSHRSLIRRRTALEAKLLAYRSGWLAPDEIRIRKLEKALAAVLGQLGEEDPLASTLLDRR